MTPKTVEAASQPMLCVDRTSTLEPGDIARAMNEAFVAVVAFLRKSGVKPAGPPVAVYHQWMNQSRHLNLCVGVPVTHADLANASGEVHACRTPSGKAIKAIHRGPYDTRHETHNELGRFVEKAGARSSITAWEVYLSNPDTTPEADLLTEIYIPVR